MGKGILKFKMGLILADWCLKGLAITFAGQETHLSSSEARKYTYISKQIKNPHKFAEIMKKNRVFGNFHS